MKITLLSLLFSLSLAAQNPYSDHVNRGKELVAGNKWAEARKEFWAARGEASGDKQNAAAAYRIAQTYRGEGNTAAALDWYKQSLHYLPSKQAQDEMMELEMQRIGKPVSASQIQSELLLPSSDRSPVVEQNSIDLDVLFDTGEATLTSEGSAQVHQLALALASPDLKNKAFLITGHTDVTGTPDGNMKLSLRRADTVRNALRAETRIPESHLKCEGKGQTSPKYQGDSKDANRLNRRVQITVVD